MSLTLSCCFCPFYIHYIHRHTAQNMREYRFSLTYIFLFKGKYGSEKAHILVYFMHSIIIFSLSLFCQILSFRFYVYFGWCCVGVVLLLIQLIICGEVSNQSTLGLLYDNRIILFNVFWKLCIEVCFCEFMQENPCSQVAMLPLIVIISVMSSESFFSIS